MADIQDWLARVRSVSTSNPPVGALSSSTTGASPQVDFTNLLANRYSSGTSLLSSLMSSLSPRSAASSSYQGAANRRLTVGQERGGSDEFRAFVNSIAKQESGGNYKAVNRSSGALGKYQIMPANIRSWSKEALGRSISPQEFLRSPQLQEAIAQHKLQNYYNKYGASGAAQAWYGGPGSVGRNVSGGKGYPSSNQYAAAVTRRLGRR